MKTIKTAALLFPLVFISSYTHAEMDLFKTFSDKVENKAESEVNSGMDKAIDDSVDGIKNSGNDSKEKEHHSKNEQDTDNESE